MRFSAADRPASTLPSSMKLRDAAHEVTVVRAQQARRHVRLGRRAVGRDARQPDPQRSGQRRLDQALLRLLGRHRRHPQGRAHGLDRPRLLRHRPQAAAACCCSGAPASSASSSVFETEVADPKPYMETHDLVVAADGLNSRARADLRRRLQARHRHAQMQVRLARHPPEIRRRLHLHLREDRARLGVGARLPVRQGHRDLHRRMQRGDLGRASASAR